MFSFAMLDTWYILLGEEIWFSSKPFVHVIGLVNLCFRFSTLPLRVYLPILVYQLTLWHVLVQCEFNQTELEKNNIEITSGDEPFHVGDAYTYDCNSGYERTTTNTIICDNDGTWSSLPGCTTSNHTTSNHTTSKHTTSNHTTSNHTTSKHTISRHTISKCT